MEKEKMIEEMMIDCQCIEKNTLSLRCRGKDCDTCRLEKLIDKGYLKVTEGSVVLTKEELAEHDEKVRKEKAAEILNDIANIDDCGFPFKSYVWFNEIAKKNGVEVE